MGTWLERRSFLKAATSASIAVSVTYGGLGATVARALSLSEGVFSVDERETLQRIFYLMLPFNEAGDVPYRDTVDTLAGTMQSKPDKLALIKKGMRQLNSLQSPSWLQLSEVDQIKGLEELEQGVFFQWLYGFAYDHVMNHPAVWQEIGYEGSSLEHGGYSQRGLDSVNWL